MELNIITKYLITKYIKFFLIVLFSLELFFVGMDLLQNLKSLPNSANLQLLYVLYNGFFTLSIVLPLSLIFGWVVFIITLIKNNEFVAFYSVGATKQQILKPIIFTALFITTILIGLQSTPMAYSEQQKKKILNNNYFTNTKENIFLKYNDYFVYFNKLYPLEKKAEGVDIYLVKDGDLVETIQAKKATFQNNKWYALDAKIIRKPSKIDWDSSKLTVTHEKFLYTLEGFKPKILDNVYSAKTNYSIIDSIQAYFLLSKQDLDTTAIRNTLYYNMLVPFFVIPAIVLIFLYSSVSNRFFQINKFSSISVALTLGLWGILFFLHKLSSGGVLIPEIALLVPLMILFIYVYILYSKKENII
ncbi:MAG: LptF/LptG family permease [Campylobacterales bacterium]|nr:LptF/LptG family permease [Campylobacterales bacterium]